MRQHAGRPFSVCMERWMGYAELERQSAALGAWLQGQGLAPGARIAAAGVAILTEGRHVRLLDEAAAAETAP